VAYTGRGRTSVASSRQGSPQIRPIGAPALGRHRSAPVRPSGPTFP